MDTVVVVMGQDLAPSILSVYVAKEESGLRSAWILLSSFPDFFRRILCIVERKPRPEWVGKTLRELELRKKHDINVIVLENKNIWSGITPDHPL